jgi:hypothetical protein
MRVAASALLAFGLSACDSAGWHYSKCRQDADAAVRAVSALERRRECNSPAQCAAVEKEREAANEVRRDAQVYGCMRSQGFSFDSERWAQDQREQRGRPGDRYWSRQP